MGFRLIRKLKRRDGKAMKNDIFEKIHQMYGQMSKGQKRISDYILKNYDKAAFMTAAKLGETVGISESTVVRFATEIGFDGYPAFQTALNEVMRTRLTAIQRIEVADTQLGTGDVLENVLNLDIERIKKTMECCSREQFNKVVDAIATAETVYVIGSRSAETIGKFLEYYLNLMMKNVHFVNTAGAGGMFQRLIHVSEKDVVIAISFPRYSKQTADAMRYASERKARVIALTDSEQSPIAQNANYLLLARSDMVSFADSLVAPLSLVNALIVALGMKKKDTVAKNFENLEELWDRYGVYEIYSHNNGSKDVK